MENSIVVKVLVDYKTVLRIVRPDGFSKNVPIDQLCLLSNGKLASRKVGEKLVAFKEDWHNLQDQPYGKRPNGDVVDPHCNVGDMIIYWKLKG